MLVARSHLFPIYFVGASSVSGQIREKSGMFRNRTNLRHYLKFAGFGVCSMLIPGIVYSGYQWRKMKRRNIELVSAKFNPWLPYYFRYKGFCIPLPAVLRLDDYKSFKVRDDDIFLVTHPRSGTTWLQEIIYLITSDLDIKGTTTEIMDHRFPFLDAFYPGLKAIDAMPSPRLLKTHMPYKLLPNDVHKKKPKIIYIARNPKDVFVSQFHFLLHFTISTTIEDVFEDFVNDRLPWNPWWCHVLQMWERKDDPNILFLKYEDLKEHTEDCIYKIGAFLGKNLNGEQVKTIVNHCDIDKMRDRMSSNYDWFDKKNFLIPVDRSTPGWIRKGKVGGWKDQLSQEMSHQIEQIMRHRLKGTGLTFREMESKTMSERTKTVEKEDTRV